MKVELLQTFITGHPVIDAEHLKIVNAINDVSASIQEQDYEHCAQLLDSFLEVCTNHFNTEEQLLKELGYPDLEDHIVFHKELIIKAKGVKALCMDMDTPDKIQRCFDEMATLLIEDVVKGDMQFVSFLIEKGVVPNREYAQAPSPQSSDTESSGAA